MAVLGRGAGDGGSARGSQGSPAPALWLVPFAEVFGYVLERLSEEWVICSEGAFLAQ